MGRSPLLVTESVSVLRPALSSISPSRMNSSPGIIGPRLPDRLVHGDELGPVRKRGLDLDVVDHLGDAGHHLRPRQHVGARLHQLGHGLAVARPFDDEVGDQRHRLRMIELDAALEPPARHHRCHRDQQLVLFTRGQVHLSPSNQFDQSRGNVAPRNAVSTSTRSCRNTAPSPAQSRTSASPFQADTPTSPRYLSPSARTTAATVSSPGETSTVASAIPPLAIAGALSLSAILPSSHSASA